jgi:5,5'-dehydrodivanillate O-demethylase
MDHYMESYRTGPDTPGGRYMRLFWFPVYRSEDLKPGWAKPIQIMSEKFTLYRGESGTPHLVAFRCAHRGLQMSVGWIEGDCIRCRYHGWKYDQTGQCVEIPTESEETARTVRIRSYPTKEYLGFVFAYLGSGEPPEFPRYPDFEKDGVLWTETYVRPCNFFYNLENDTLHIPFAHRESEIYRTRPIEVPRRIEAQESEWGITLRTTFPGGRIQVAQYDWPTIRTFKTPDRDHIVWRVPIEDESHASFQLDIMHITEGEEGNAYQERHAARTGKLGRPYAELGEAILKGDLRIQDIEGDDKANMIWIQDYVAQVGVGRFSERKNERLIRADAGVLLYRKIWEREVAAFSEGRSLKKWHRSSQLIASYRDHRFEDMKAKGPEKMQQI